MVVCCLEGSPTLVHARSGFRLSFHHGIQARQLVVLSGIHYFDAHRLYPSLAAHLNMPVERRSQAVATEEGHEAASASATDIEDSSSDDASTAASDPADPPVAWCPPIPDAVDDPTEQEIASAADQLDILISQPTTAGNPFCHPANLTLVKYDLSIDGIPWVIFSTLNDALYREFKEGFFTTLNFERKDRWDFEKVAWLDGPNQYDVDYP